MFSKCANPDCTYTFDFRFGRVMRSQQGESRGGGSYLLTLRTSFLVVRKMLSNSRT